MKEARTLNDVEWVADDEPASEPGPRQGLPVAALILAVALGLAIVGLGIFTLSSHERVQAPTPPATPVPTPVLDLESFNNPETKIRFETVLATLPDLTLVLPQFGGQSAIRVASGTQVEIDTEVLEQVHTLSVDYSGQWIGGLGGRPSGEGATLWIGRVDEPLEPVATGVLGFAWHESRAGLVAFTTAGDADAEPGALFLVDANADPREPERAFAVDGHLELWGNWGFVTRPALNGSGFHVLDSEGQDVATGYQGSVVGAVNQRLVVNLAGGRQSPVFIFADTGRAWPIFALTDTSVARSVASGGFGDPVAMQVSDNETDTHEIRIFPGNGDPVQVVATTEATGALTWSADSSTLYFLSQDVSDSTDLYEYHVATKQLTATPVGDAASINHWASSIAVGKSVDG